MDFLTKIQQNKCPQVVFDQKLLFVRFYWAANGSYVKSCKNRNFQEFLSHFSKMAVACAIVLKSSETQRNLKANKILKVDHKKNFIT